MSIKHGAKLKSINKNTSLEVSNRYDSKVVFDSKNVK